MLTECAAVVLSECHAWHHNAVLMENVKMIHASRIHVNQPFLVILVCVEFVNAVVRMLVLGLRRLVTMELAFQQELL